MKKPKSNKEKRTTKKTLTYLYGGVGGFQAGIVNGSAHPRNNIYLKIIGNDGKYDEIDFTVDEAAAIINVLASAIAQYTQPKRDVLAPITPIQRKRKKGI